MPIHIVVIPAKAGIHLGDTSNLLQRIAQHREKLVAGFTARYGLKKLVWYELHENAESAIVREKQIKKWSRAWKIELIERTNPDWRDLYQGIV